MDIDVLQAVPAPVCVQENIGGGVYVCMKEELCGQDRKQAYVGAETLRSGHLRRLDCLAVC